MAQKKIHQQVLAHIDEVCAWFDKISGDLPLPIYSSYDIRDAGFKITNVDANVYPAGFNNICPTDKETSTALMGDFIREHYGEVRRVLLVTEEHTANKYYWDNVQSILQLVEGSGIEARAGFAKTLEGPLEVVSHSGHRVQLLSATPDGLAAARFSPDLIISNNDFSEAHEDWARQTSLPINPPRELGWYQRKKSRYFRHYNQLVREFCGLTDLDPFLLTVATEEFEGFDIESADSREALAVRVDRMLDGLRAEYATRGLQQEPFVFVKNNAGTYGLAVIRVGSGDDVRNWSYKSRKKMKAAKGGREVDDVIIQEGVPSIVKAEGHSAEPVIYMIGAELAGGFLRTHAEKDETESLNSPGAVYKRLCVSDLVVDRKGCPNENVYGWSAKLGLVAIAREAREMGVEFKAYR